VFRPSFIRGQFPQQFPIDPCAVSIGSSYVIATDGLQSPLTTRFRTHSPQRAENRRTRCGRGKPATCYPTCLVRSILFAPLSPFCKHHFQLANELLAAPSVQNMHHLRIAKVQRNSHAPPTRFGSGPRRVVHSQVILSVGIIFWTPFKID